MTTKIEIEQKTDTDFIVDIDGYVFRSIYRIDMKLEPKKRLDNFIEQVSEEVKQSIKRQLINKFEGLK